MHSFFPCAISPVGANTPLKESKCHATIQSWPSFTLWLLSVYTNESLYCTFTQYTLFIRSFYAFIRLSISVAVSFEITELISLSPSLSFSSLLLISKLLLLPHSDACCCQCCVVLLGCAILVWTVPSLDSPGTRERSFHQYRMELYVCMLRLFLFAYLCECCAFVLPSSASFLSPSPFALAHLWWSAHVVPPGVSLLLFASVPVRSRCTLLKLHLAFSLLVVAYTFPVWQVIVGWHALGVWSILCPCQSWRWMPPPHTLLQLTVIQVLLSTVNFVMGDCEELKIDTFNTNGLGVFKKRKDLFDFLRKQSAHISCNKKHTGKQGQRMWSDHSGVLNVLLLGRTVQVKE